MNKPSDRPYFAFSRFLKEKFGQKVYRVSIDAGFTCPNVDGTVAVGGCVYCDNRSFSPNRRLPRQTVREQVEAGVAIMRKRYGAEKFLAYFQAGTNTYAPVEKLKRLYDEALSHPDIVGLMIGTRPDCVPEPILAMLEKYARKLWVCLELGLQTIHDRSLNWMNRGDSFHSFADAVPRAKGRGMDLCAHVILGLPGENRDDMMATIDTCSAFGMDAIKIHNLHVVRDTPMEQMYRDGQIPLFEFDEYVTLVCDVLERLPTEMVIHRLNGDAPPDYLIAPAWCLDKASLLAAIEREFQRRGTRQGVKSVSKRRETAVRRIPLPLS
jgi:radical SAM protein (TIGR01212 family)